ncbi:MAG: ABC transporter permease [Patescibacteria group bacterium]|jgi:lipopolysaccharide transport system permease protein
MFRQEVSVQTKVITPPTTLLSLNIKEFWRFRELFYIFVWRDVKVRYKQTMLGIAWAVFQPLVTMLIFTVFFGNLAKIPSDGVPYPIFVYAGLLLWNYYSVALTNISTVLVAQESIIKKVYFPRLILPLATALTPTIDLVFSFFVFIGLMFYFHFVPHVLGIVIMPVLIFFTFLNAAGLGLFLSSLNVKYRDVQYIVPFFIQILLFVTPVIYPVSMIPAKYTWLAWLNPMAGIITTARATLLGGPIQFWPVVFTIGLCLFLFLFGIVFFRKTERFFADIL